MEAMILERRRRGDRRVADQGPPPRCSERRRLVERRIPRVEEVDVSDAEWEALFAARRPRPAVADEGAAAREAAALVLGRVRE